MGATGTSSKRPRGGGGEDSPGAPAVLRALASTALACATICPSCVNVHARFDWFRPRRSARVCRREATGSAGAHISPRNARGTRDASGSSATIAESVAPRTRPPKAPSRHPCGFAVC